MPKVTYHEYRPGRWVKLVDGKAVGPATAEEVAQWRREKAEQSKIWQDVVEEATDAASQPEQADEVTIWQDVVSQVSVPESKSARPPRAATPTRKPAEPEPTPPATIDEAIWSARHGKPVVVRDGRVVTADTGEKPAAPPKTKPAPAKSVPAVEAAQPEPAHKPTEAAKAEPTPAVKITAAAKAEQPVRRRKEVAPVETPTRPEPVPTAEPVPAKAPAKPKRKRMRAAPAKEAAQPQPVPAAEARSAAEPEKPARKRVKTPPARKAAKPKPTPTVTAAPPAEATEVEPQPTTRARRTPRTRSTAARRRKGVPPPTPKGFGPSYLWMMAGAAEDLPTAVRGGLARYEERFNEPAGAVLCHADDLPTLEGAGLPVDVRQGNGVPPGSFWIGSK